MFCFHFHFNFHFQFLFFAFIFLIFTCSFSTSLSNVIAFTFILTFTFYCFMLTFNFTSVKSANMDSLSNITSRASCEGNKKFLHFPGEQYLAKCVIGRCCQICRHSCASIVGQKKNAAGKADESEVAGRQAEQAGVDSVLIF